MRTIKSKNISFFILSFLVIILNISSLKAATYYLDGSATGGSRDGSSWENAWTSISEAQQGIAALPDDGSGDTLLIAGGEYQGQWYEINNQVRNDFLTFEAAPSEKVILVRPDDSQIVVYLKGGTHNYYLRFKDLEIQGRVWGQSGAGYVEFINCRIGGGHPDDSKWKYAGETLNSGPITFSDSHHIKIENCEIHQGCKGVEISDSEFITVRKNHIHGMRTWGSHIHSCNNSLVELNHIHDIHNRSLTVEDYYDNNLFATDSAYVNISDESEGYKVLELGVGAAFGTGVLGYFNFSEPLNFVEPRMLTGVRFCVTSTTELLEGELVLRISADSNGGTASGQYVEIPHPGITSDQAADNDYVVASVVNIHEKYPDLLTFSARSVAMVLKTDKNAFSLKIGTNSVEGIKFTDREHTNLLSACGDNIIIRKNILHDGGSQGIFTMSYRIFTNAVIENNLIYDLGGTQLMNIDVGQNVQVKNNTVIGKYLAGAETDYFDMAYIHGGVNVSYNTVKQLEDDYDSNYDYAQKADILPIEPGSVIITVNGNSPARCAVARDNNGTFTMYDEDGQLFDNTYTSISGTIDYQTGEIKVNFSPTVTTPFVYAVYEQAGAATSLKIHNNLIAGSLVSESEDKFTSNSIVQYQDPAGSSTLVLRDVPGTGTGSNTGYYTFDNDFFVNPDFEPDHGNIPDFRLKAGSPAINFGNPLTQSTESLGTLDANGFIMDNGITRNSARHSVGCYEFGDPSLGGITTYIEPVGAQSVYENQRLEFTVVATEADVQVSTSALPEGATFAENTFSWTPGYDQAGSYTVDIIAEQGGEIVDGEIMNITVNNVNRAPVLAAVGDKAVDEGSTLTFAVSGTDADGDQLNYLAWPLPDGATFENQVFTWTPDGTQAGDYTLNLAVADPDGFEDLEAISITVNDVTHDDQINSAPVFDAVSDVQIAEAQKLSLAVRATDPDGDALEYSITNLPAGATFINKQLMWVPEYGTAGNYMVTFAATDGEVTTEATVLIEVVPAEQSWLGLRMIHYWQATLGMLGQL